ncbi:DUF3509 domain-containing protein [Pseudomonas sp. microsymbiont 2]
MERICRLLNDALTPYRAELGVTDDDGNRQLTLYDERGEMALRRKIPARQLAERQLLVDLVDGLHRDLQIMEGRLQPCVIAAMQHARQPQGTFARGG